MRAEETVRPVTGTLVFLEKPRGSRSSAICTGLLEKQGKLEAAMAKYKRALTIQEKAHGKDHPQVAITLTNMGVVLEKQGKLEEAM